MEGPPRREGLSPCLGSHLGLLGNTQRGLASSVVQATPLAGVGCPVMVSTKEGAPLVEEVVLVFVFEV